MNNSYNSRKYVLNQNYFKIIDTQEKAYILGLFLSDGYICEKDYKVGFTSIDKEIILNIKTNMDATNPIYEHFYKNNKMCYEINLNSKILYQDILAYRQNIYKKDIACIPKNIPDKLLVHFIRGYFDGDGCIRLKNNKTQLCFDIASYEGILAEISSIIDKNINKSHKTNIKPHGNIFRITYSGNKQCEKIYNYLYKEATIFLTRKKLIFESKIKPNTINKGK